MCLCTCVKAFVTTLPKFSRQNSDKFLLNFWKWGKNNKPCKNFLCKNLRLNMYHDFLASLRNHACKSTKDLFLSKSQKDSKAILFDESNSLLQFIPWKKWKKNLHLDTQNPVVTTLSKKFLSKFWKHFARIPEIMKSLCAFPTKLFLPKTFVKHAQWNFGKPGVILSPKIRKNFPNSKSVEVTNFSTIFFFVKKDPLAT